MALNRVEKQVGVTVKVDAGGALRAWREYKKAQDGARDSTKRFGDGLEASNARIINQREALKKAIDTFERASAAQARATSNLGKATSSLHPILASAIGTIGGMGVTSLAGAAFRAAGALANLGEESARTQDVFRNLAFSIDPARKATHGFIDDMQLATFANQAAAIGITETAGDFADFAGAIQKLAARSKTSTEQMFNSMIAAVGRGSTEMLDNAGIVLKVDQAHEIYAKQLGKTKDALTETEKAEAFRRVAMQKIFEAAEEITITTDGAAAATKRYAAEIANLKTAALGGEDRVTSLRVGFAKLNETTTVSAKELRTYGSASDQVRDQLVALGVSTEQVSKLTTNDLVRGIAVARKEEEQRLLTLASEGKLTSEYRDQLERVVPRMDMATLSAQNLAAALERIRVADAAQSMADLNAQLNIQIGLQAQLDNAAMVDAEMAFKANKGKGGDRFARQRAEFNSALMGAQRQAGLNAMNRDTQTARGEFSAQLGPAQQQAAMQDAARVMGDLRRQEAEELQRQAQMRQKLHEQELKRIEAEKRAQMELLRKRMEIVRITTSLTQDTMGLAEEVAVATASSERKATMIKQAFAASRATVVGVEETVLAAQSFAALNPVQGALHAGAAALAYAKAGLLAGGVIGPGAGAGAGGGGGGIGGGSSSGGTRSNARSASDQEAPISRRGEQHSPPTASGGSKGPVTVQFNSYLPPDKEKMGTVIREAIRVSEQSFGSSE